VSLKRLRTAEIHYVIGPKINHVVGLAMDNVGPGSTYTLGPKAVRMSKSSVPLATL